MEDRHEAHCACSRWLSSSALAAERILLRRGLDWGGRRVDWQGEGEAIVTTIDAEHRSPLDPNNLLVGNAPGDLIEFARDDFPHSILPLRITEGDNVAVSTIERGGDIESPNVFDFSGTFKPLDLEMMLKELLSDEPGGELWTLAAKIRMPSAS